MKLIPTSLKDLPSIMAIVPDAQEYLLEQEIDQWQDGYPSEEQILSDITNKESYVVANDSGELLGTTVLTTRKESTYNVIAGSWLTADHAEYGVIHRLAVGKSSRKLGVAKFVFTVSETMLGDLGINSMRIDTHEDNKGMQQLLKKIGYQYCGVIYLENGDKRLAFEKLFNFSD